MYEALPTMRAKFNKTSMKDKNCRLKIWLNGLPSVILASARLIMSLAVFHAVSDRNLPKVFDLASIFAPLFH